MSMECIFHGSLFILQNVSCSVLVPGSVLSLCANPDTGTAVVQLTSGKVMKYSMLDSEKYDLSPWQLDSGSNLNFGEQLCCEKIELALFNGKVWFYSCLLPIHTQGEGSGDEANIFTSFFLIT